MMCKNDRLNYLKALAALCMTVPLFLIYSYVHYDAVQPGKIIYSSFRERSAAETSGLAEGKMEIVHPKTSDQTATSRSAERPDLQNPSVTTNRPQQTTATNNPHFATTSKTVSSATHKPHKVELPVGSEPVVTMASAQHIALETKDLTRAEYPDWWLAAYSRSMTFGSSDQFVGDRPLFPPCVESPNRKDSYPMVEPKRYMSRTKNPCWMETRGESAREMYCIPYFYVAGVAKCGTSDIYRRVRQHPDVMRGTMKEYHWWDRRRFDDITESGDKVSFKDYSLMVTGKTGTEAVFKDLRMNGSSVKIFGDGSPSYFWEIHNWPFLDGNQGCLEPRVVIGQHILHVYPNVKMILTFRHPRTRLYSRFLARLSSGDQLKGATVVTFHELVVRATRLYRQCFEKWSVRHCAYNITLFDEAVTRLMEGMYPVFMADWLRIFPRQQMHIIRYEDYAKDLEGEMRKMFTFLGLAPISAEEMVPIVERPKVNVGSDMYEKMGQMLPETAAILDEFYQPFINKFAEMLGDERFLWKDIQLP